MRSIGVVLHSAVYYDLIAKLFTFGRERIFREEMLSLANLKVGENVLDVGCGTGTLAIAAKKLVGSQGGVHAIDASTEMLARARKKLASTDLDVHFEIALAQELPFPDGTFDVVFATLMFHHLPRLSRTKALAEIGRVLKPNGRVLIVEFGRGQHHGGLLSRIHRHGHVKKTEIDALIGESGLVVRSTGHMRKRDLYYVECVN